MRRAHPVRSFRRAWRRQAERLPALGRSGRWALDLARERPRLSEGPLFGTALGELTGAEAAQREAPQRPARRGGRAEETPAFPTPAAAGESAIRRFPRREEPREPAPPRELPTEAPGADLARWAGEPAVPPADRPVRRKREQPAQPHTAPDAESVTFHQKEIAARSLRPLSVAGRSKELSGSPGSIPERSVQPATPDVSGLRENRSDTAKLLTDPRSGSPDASFSESTAPIPLSSLPHLEERKKNPWRTLVSGTQAPRTLLAAQENALPSRREKNPTPGASFNSERPAPPLFGSAKQPAGSAPPDLPRSSHDRSDAPPFDAREAHATPFTPIAGDPLSPHSTASPLGPFPGAAAVGRTFETAQDAPAFPTDSFPAFSSAPASADELNELAAKIERILTDEARRHGIDV